MRNIFAKLPTTTKLWHVLVPMLTVVNILHFVKNPLLDMVVLGFFLFAPGYLFLANLRHTVKKRWLTTCLSVGLSVLLILLGGLLLNGLHYIGLDQPLSTSNIFMMLDALVLGLLIPIRRVTFKMPRTFRRPDNTSLIAVPLLSLMPLMAVGGAISLNNGGTNVLAMSMFAAVFLAFIVLIWGKKRLEYLYPYAVFTMGLSVLLATSLRGWGVTGHDIHHEFQAFQTVLQSGFWDASPAIKDPYNACLSITILPAILAKITSISAVFIYKFVFQVIYAFSLVAMYLFAKRLGGARIALISTFIFISFPPFLNDISFLNRQELAFLFFSLILLVNFEAISRRLKTVLSAGFLLGLILSHYSTGYVTLGILLLAWAVYKVLTYKKAKGEFFPLLSLPLILSALLFTFLWNTQITATSPGLEKIMRTLTQGSANQSSGISYSVFSADETRSPETKIKEYAGDKSSEVAYTPEKDLPETSLGNAMGAVVEPSAFNAFIRSTSAKFLQVLLLLGAVIMFFRYRHKTLRQPTYYYALVVASTIILAMMIVLPQLSANYSVTRLFQQNLMIIGVPMVLALMWMLSRIKTLRLNIAALIFGLMFLHLSGFIPQLIGGYPPQMALNNAGVYYDIYYDHQGEVSGAHWLAARDEGNIIAADSYAKMQFPNYPLQAERIFNPLKADHQASYLFQDYSNTQKGIYTSFLGGDVIQYTYEGDLGQRQLLYSNSVSKVYGGRYED